MRRRALALPLAAAFVLFATAAYAAYPQTAPNDPRYASAEQSPLDCATKATNDEQHYLYSFMPQCTKLATDPEGASGMAVDKAWRDYTTGRPDTVIAYVEGGINWHVSDAAELANRVYLNRNELPVPCTGNPCTTRHSTVAADYDVDHNAQFNAADYAHDPRVHDTNGNGLLDPEDLIARFSDAKDDDANGYVDDISGWDFYDNQNDPATIDSTYMHSDNQMKQAAAEANNALGGAGICPKCTILPVKAGAEALDRTDDLAEAWLFAADSGASVIVSVTADLGYSSFMRQVVEKLWRQGIVMAESSNDFDSTDHQGGMFWPHVLPGNGLVSNSQGVPGPAGNLLTTTYRARSDLTSWGTHAMFSVSTDGGSTSESTPTVGGVAALVSSYGKIAASRGLITSALSGPEVVQVMRATTSDIADSTLAWPGAPGWDLQYGYGRPNVWRAMQAVQTGNVPPVGWIASPDWYALYDPTHTATVPVTGHVEARRSASYSYTLQYALGAQPADNTFHTIGSGSGTAPKDATLGTLDLAQIPQSFWNAAAKESTTKSLEASEQYTVTLRLRVRDAQGRIGEDRRTIAVHHDAALLNGFPKKISASGESQPALVDLQGTGRLDIAFGDADGFVHAIDPATGKELPGWPVTTDPTKVTKTHAGIDPGHEPLLAGVSVGDLDQNGALSVVASTMTGKVYAWDAHGVRRAGWPKAIGASVAKPAIPRPALAHTRPRAAGASASPVLIDLDGDGKLDIVEPGWDGRVYAWHASGAAVAGWPVTVALPAGFTPPPGYKIVNDPKLPTAPAVADLDGDGRPELVVKSQYSAILADDIEPLGIGYVFAYHADGSSVAGWPAPVESLIEYYGSAQEFITEGAAMPAAADVDGDGKDEVAIAQGFGLTRLLRGDGTVAAIYGTDATALAAFTSVLNNPAAVLSNAYVPVDVPINFTTSGAFGKLAANGALSYAEPGTGAGSIAAALLVPGSGVAIHNLETAYDARTGVPRPGFPTTVQGLAFLSAPVLADVTGDSVADVIETADSSALSAHDGAGKLAPAFPKFTGGWGVFSPSVGDLLSNGTNEVVMLTREGQLFAWRTSGRSSGGDEWWTYRHDEHRTGRYGVDARPPGAVRAATFSGPANVVFTAPGDNWYTGAVASYRVRVDGGAVRAVAPHGGAGTRETVAVGTGSHTVTVQAVDRAGNLGTPITLQR